MGSKLSKAVRPHKAAPASQQGVDNSTKAEPRQDPAPREGGLKAVIARVVTSSDDLDLTSTTFAAPQRRNSEPSPDMSGQPRSAQNRASLLASFEEYVALRSLGGIDMNYTPLLVPQSPLSDVREAQDLPLPPPPPPSHQQVPIDDHPQCLVCCTQLPKEKDLEYSSKVVKPCRECDNEYCGDCVKKLFIDACKDMSRMPPRCCVRINLHHARPFLSDDEAALFRAKYDEWSTPKPFYCPVPICSAFIPPRLLPQQVTTKNKSRVDSGVGTPTAKTFACPTCVANICTVCRQVAHPGTNCEINEFGLDADTAALLISWGYKKCPKCGHGVKRMYGCNHMECRCGAHFCWICLEEKGQCQGECYESDEDYDGDDQSEPDEEEDPETAELSQEPKVEGVTRPEDSGAVVPEPEATARVRNLDGGRARYWEDSGLDFGEEPQDIQDKSWDCNHSFYEYEISLSEAFGRPGAHDMECVKCWTTVQPLITTPSTSRTSRPRKVPASSHRHLRGGIRRARGRYTPPRGLIRHDATIGTAPHLTASLSQSVPLRPTSPMEDVQTTGRIMDTHGNMISTAPLEQIPTRSASIPYLNSNTTKSIKPHSSILNTDTMTFSFAHECISCHILVCTACKDIAMGEHITAPTEAPAQDDSPTHAESTITHTPRDSPGQSIQASTETPIPSADMAFSLFD